MEANNFIGKLKANGTETDIHDIIEISCEHKKLLSKNNAKDRAALSLNVLCIFCRNLDKVPTWKNKIDSNALITLCIDCVKETKVLEKNEQIKILACIYHIHKHMIRQDTPLQPELVLKLSTVPFESETKDLLKEYAKTYWNIIADRITYIERLKTLKLAIIKLLPKLLDDVLKVIQIYDTVQFCANILTFTIKKLHYLYSDKYNKELNNAFATIFRSLALKNEVNLFKKLTDDEMLDLYIKFNDCLYVIAENASKASFKDAALNVAVRSCVSFLGHKPDMFHCLQTFYMNSLCSILTDQVNITFTDTCLNSLVMSCETTERLGYSKAMRATYPYIGQFLRLYIEFHVTNCEKLKWNSYFTVEVQESCLKLIKVLVKKMRSTPQFLKCENCNVKSGLHDALRILFLVKHFVSISLSQNMDIKNILPLFYEIIEEQHIILLELINKGCVNYDKCYKKMQTDIHNTAISLNKAQHYQYSIKLFDLYLTKEIRYFKSDADMKNISRALYNKSICQLDYKLYESALTDAFLSLVFSAPQGLSSDKYMSLVMDIKAKALKQKENDEDSNEEADDLQMFSILDACRLSVEKCSYGNLRPFINKLKFSILLNHEFEMYAKLWPSIVPISGVWTALNDLVNLKHTKWLPNESESSILWALLTVMLQTPAVVRTIHNEHFANILRDVLEKQLRYVTLSPELEMVKATLLFLKADYDLADASQKYGWKITEPTLDPDMMPCNRTVPREHAAITSAIEAVDLYTELIKDIDSVPTRFIPQAVQICEVFVQQLLFLNRTAEALQLAYVSCVLAERIGDKVTYVRNTGVLLRHLVTSHACHLVPLAVSFAASLQHSQRDVVVQFMTDTAFFYKATGKVGVAARLVLLAQANILECMEKHPDINLDMSLGGLLEAQAYLCEADGVSVLTAAHSVQRHYLAVGKSGSSYLPRRLHSLRLKHRLCLAAVSAVRTYSSLHLSRRARAAAAHTQAAGAVTMATVLARAVSVYKQDETQVTIDNRLKHILGLQPTNDTQLQTHHSPTQPIKETPFTPKHECLEPMRENMIFKKTQISPSLPCVSVSAFKIPEFLKHQNSCSCYACNTPLCFIIACQICGLEASTYFRAKEYEIARNYFEGTIECFALAERKLNDVAAKYREKYQDFVVNSIEQMYKKEFEELQIEILIDAAYFELNQKEFAKADEKIIRIYDIIQEANSMNKYLNNEVNNLVVASAKLREIVKVPEDIGLESELENLHLSPVKDEIEPPKTPPITKPVPPKVPITKHIVKDEEIPNVKRKVIKLNLDEDEKEPTTRRRVVKKTEFKIPVPVTSKAVLEAMTPRPTRSKPNILITQPSDDFKVSDKTPKASTATEFFTPNEATPSDQFFTPMTSIRTYAKKSLRQGIVKNLEKEFSTPKAESSDKENGNVPIRGKKVESGSMKTLKDKKILKRATSPGKLVSEDKPSTRPRRLRQPVNFSLDKGDK